MSTKRQHGFTLVEIAIVLVVIGLLLGGILKGQQLINSARVRNLADQNSGVQAAYYGFVDRFRSLPGDMVAATACTTVSNTIANCGGTPDIGGTAGTTGGNGRIDTIIEASAVWAHLSAAGFLNGTFSGTDAAGGTLDTAAEYAVAVPTGGVPPNAFQGPILLGHSNDYLTSTARDSVVRLAFSFGGNIPVTILRDLDQKLDDGVAGTGVMRSAADTTDTTNPAGTYAAITDYTIGTSNNCVNATTPATWFVDSNNQTCNAFFLY